MKIDNDDNNTKPWGVWDTAGVVVGVVISAAVVYFSFA